MDEREAWAVLSSVWEDDAEVWETLWVPVFREFAQELSRRVALKPGERLLDVGTGSGLVLQLAAPQLGPEGRAVGIDRSRAMVERARRNVAAGALPARVLEMDARLLDFPDEWFDVVTSNCGVPFLALADVLAEIRRVLKPGGRFLWSEWSADKVAGVRIFNEVLDRYKTTNPSARLRRYREAAGAYAATMERFKERKDFERALKDAGFREVSGDTLSHAIRTMTREQFTEARSARYLARIEIAEMTEASREGFHGALREALSHLEQEGAFVLLWPIFYMRGLK